MSKVFSIAVNTFKEAVRNRVLYVLLFFAILIMFGAWIASTLSIDENTKVVRDLGVGAINFISLLIAVFVGVGLVYNDLDKKTIYTIVSKPISRWQFLLGKYFGLLLTIAVNVLFMTFIFCAVLHFRHYMASEQLFPALYKELPDGKFEQIGSYPVYLVTSTVSSLAKGLFHIITLGHDSFAPTSGLFQASLMTIFEMAIITAFAVLFSSFSSPTLSAFLTAIIFIIGRLNQSIYLFADTMLQKIGSFDAMTMGQKIAYYFALGSAYLAPNLAPFNPREQIAAGLPVQFRAMDLTYGAVYCVAVMVIATLIFNRRNFK